LFVHGVSFLSVVGADEKPVDFSDLAEGLEAVGADATEARGLEADPLPKFEIAFERSIRAPNVVALPSFKLPERDEPPPVLVDTEAEPEAAAFFAAPEEEEDAALDLSEAPALAPNAEDLPK
jgi:hypothetical protein